MFGWVNRRNIAALVLPVIFIFSATYLADANYLKRTYENLLYCNKIDYRLVAFTFFVYLKDIQESSPVIYAGTTGTIGYAVTSLFRIIVSVISRNKKHKEYQKLIQESGLNLFTASFEDYVSTKNSKVFSPQNLGYKNGDLSFLLINGGVILNNKKFRSIIESHKGLVRILLYNGDAYSSRRRAEVLGISETTYNNNVKKAKDFLQKIKKKDKKIEIRYYSSPPLFRLVMNTKICFCHGYFPDSSVFGGLETSEGYDGFHGLFEQAFNSMWDDSKPESR